MTKSYSPDHYKDLLHLHTTVHSHLRIGFGGNSVSAIRPRTHPIYARSERQGATVQHHRIRGCASKDSSAAMLADAVDPRASVLIHVVQALHVS